MFCCHLSAMSPNSKPTCQDQIPRSTTQQPQGKPNAQPQKQNDEEVIDEQASQNDGSLTAIPMYGNLYRETPLTMARWLQENQNQHFVDRISGKSKFRTRSKPPNKAHRHHKASQRDSRTNRTTNPSTDKLPFQGAEYPQDICLLHIGSWCSNGSTSNG